MLYIIRHGKTDWNNQYRLQGRTDIPLNDEGREMAERARESCLDVHFDLCYCSPLSRAKETAEILLRDRAVPIIEDARLIEMSFGVCEGLVRCFQIPDCPVKPFFLDPENYTEPPEGAESMEDLFRRTGEFLEELVYPKLSEGKDILIVGHGAMNSSIVCQVKRWPVRDFWKEGIENCRLVRLI